MTDRIGDVHITRDGHVARDHPQAADNSVSVELMRDLPMR